MPIRDAGKANHTQADRAFCVRRTLLKAMLRGRRLWVAVAVLWVVLIVVTAPLWLSVFLAGLAALGAAGVLAMRRSSQLVRSLSPVAALLGLALLGGSWWLGTAPTLPPLSAAPASITATSTPTPVRVSSASPTPSPSSLPPSSIPVSSAPVSSSAVVTPTEEPSTTVVSTEPQVPEPTTLVATPTKDVCPNGDWTGDRYDRRCGFPPAPATTKSVEPPTSTPPTVTPTPAAPATDKCPEGDNSGDLYDATCHRKVPRPVTKSPGSPAASSTGALPSETLGA